jgi:hypothetical protein
MMFADKMNLKLDGNTTRLATPLSCSGDKKTNRHV